MKLKLFPLMINFHFFRRDDQELQTAKSVLFSQLSLWEKSDNKTDVDESALCEQIYLQQTLQTRNLKLYNKKFLRRCSNCQKNYRKRCLYLSINKYWMWLSARFVLWQEEKISPAHSLVPLSKSWFRQQWKTFPRRTNSVSRRFIHT